MKSISYTLIIFLLISALIISGCTTRNLTDNQIFKDISVEESKELIKHNKNNLDFTILDIRTPEEFKTGHIESAINLDFYASNFSNELNTLNKRNIYFIYCRSGNRSGQAMKIMKSLGFYEVYNLSGGISDWIADGLPIK